MKRLAIAAVGLALVVAASACGGGDGPLEGRRVRLILEPDVSEAPDVDVESALDAAADIIERRLDAFGASRARVRQEEENRLSVEVADMTAAEARRLIGDTGFFEFRQPKLDEDDDVVLCEGGTVTYDPPGCEGGEEFTMSLQLLTPSEASVRIAEAQESIIWIPARAIDSDGLETDLTGRFLKGNTYVASNPITGLPELHFEMTEEGAGLLEQVTTRLVGLPMAFFVDSEPIRGEHGRIIAPIVQTVLSDQGIMTGLIFEDPHLLSIQLNAGAFPVPLEIVSIEELSE